MSRLREGGVQDDVNAFGLSLRKAGLLLTGVTRDGGTEGERPQEEQSRAQNGVGCGYLA